MLLFGFLDLTQCAFDGWRVSWLTANCEWLVVTTSLSPPDNNTIDMAQEQQQVVETPTASPVEVVVVVPQPVMKAAEDRSTEVVVGSEQKYETPTIANVINTFEAFAYDDDQRGRKHLSSMVAAHAKSVIQWTAKPDEVKLTMISELDSLAKVIKDRKKKDGIWSPKCDLRYGHHYVQHWIMARWFMGAKRPEDLPNWYRAECKHVKDQTDVLTSVEETLVRLRA